MLSPRAQRGLALQRAVARALSPLSTFAVVVLLRVWLHLRLDGAAEARRTYAALRDEGGPVLVCANHLTLIDSALVAWALGTPAWYVRHFASLPWNVPERRNFASTRLRRALAYVYKCVPVLRGGDRAGVADTLARFVHVLSRGDTGLLFPEGGRSRSARVEVEGAAYGVGRVVKALPACRVLCVYLRGDRQDRYSDLPAKGDLLRVRVARLEPKSDSPGLRGSRDIARQIAAKLAEMEREHFAALEAAA